MKTLKQIVEESQEAKKKVDSQYGNFIDMHNDMVEFAYNGATWKDASKIKAKYSNDLDKFLEDNLDKFDDRVKAKYDFYIALKNKDIDALNKIKNDWRKWDNYFSPYITSAGEGHDGDNRQYLFGCAEVVSAIYLAAIEIGLNKIGNRLADYEFDDIIKAIS